MSWGDTTVRLAEARSALAGVLRGRRLGARWVASRLEAGDARRARLGAVAQAEGAALDYRRASDLARLFPERVRYTEVDAAVPIADARPPLLEDWAWEVFQGDRLETVGPNFVVRLHDGVVVGPSGWVGASERLFVSDLWNDPQTRVWHNADEVLAHLRAGRRRVPGTAAVVTTQWPENYYHWMIQAVPRLRLVHAVVDPGAIDWYVVPRLTKPFQWESLALAGVEARKVVQMAEGSVTADRVIASNVPAEGSYHAGQRWIAEYVRACIPPAAGREAGERIYVERGRVTARRLINERAVGRALARRGFRPVSMDHLSLRDQAAVFGAARVIVAVHGAALANLVHARPGTTVVELLPANYLQPAYKRMCEAYGLRYLPVVGSEPHLPVDRYFRLPEADLRIEVPALEAALADAIAG